MEYRILGKTGLKISRMGFGGIPIQKIDEEGTCKLFHEMAEKGLISDDELNEDYVIPDAFNKKVKEEVAKAVAEAARKTGVARI